MYDNNIIHCTVIICKIFMQISNMQFIMQFGLKVVKVIQKYDFIVKQ